MALPLQTRVTLYTHTHARIIRGISNVHASRVQFSRTRFLRKRRKKRTRYRPVDPELIRIPGATCVLVSRIKQAEQRGQSKKEGRKRGKKNGKSKAAKEGAERKREQKARRAIQLVECYFRRTRRDSIRTEGDSLLPQRSQRGETGREHEGIMFAKNCRDGDGCLLSNHRMTSLLTSARVKVSPTGESVPVRGRLSRSIVVWFDVCTSVKLSLPRKCRSYIFPASVLASPAIRPFKVLHNWAVQGEPWTRPPCASFKKWFSWRGFAARPGTFYRGRSLHELSLAARPWSGGSLILSDDKLQSWSRSWWREITISFGITLPVL